jgi:hypothetical protein
LKQETVSVECHQSDMTVVIRYGERVKTRSAHAQRRVDKESSSLLLLGILRLRIPLKSRLSIDFFELNLRPLPTFYAPFSPSAVGHSE